MALVHACSLCGWSRPAGHPTVVDPRCERCGGVLQAVEHAATAGRVLPALRVRTALERGLVALLLVPTLLAALKVGWSAGGAALGAGALVLASLCAFVALAPRR